MSSEFLVLMCLAMAGVAFLYSSVGHAGASGYIAVMSLAGLAPATIRPVALVLNILVASIGAWQFWRAGHFSWRLFWPFAVASVPCAFLGGYLRLPNQWFQILIGIVLLFSAYRFFAHPQVDEVRSSPRLPVALAAGAGLGLLAGLTGTGGGIFLTPLLLLKRWARTKEAAAVSVVFILMNSVSGLAGNLSSTRQLPAFTWHLAAAVAVGGFVGSSLGSRRFSPELVKRLLACVLLVAGFKLILT